MVGSGIGRLQDSLSLTGDKSAVHHVNVDPLCSGVDHSCHLRQLQKPLTHSKGISHRQRLHSLRRCNDRTECVTRVVLSERKPTCSPSLAKFAERIEGDTLQERRRAQPKGVAWPAHIDITHNRRCCTVRSSLFMHSTGDEHTQLQGELSTVRLRQRAKAYKISC